MNTTEANVRQNDKILVTMGSREIEGFHSKGAGFLIEGTADFIHEGSDFTEMREKFPWARAVLQIKPISIAQTL